MSVEIKRLQAGPKGTAGNSTVGDLVEVANALNDAAVAADGSILATQASLANADKLAKKTNKLLLRWMGSPFGDVRAGADTLSSVLSITSPVKYFGVELMAFNNWDTAQDIPEAAVAATELNLGSDPEFPRRYTPYQNGNIRTGIVTNDTPEATLFRLAQWPSTQFRPVPAKKAGATTVAVSQFMNIYPPDRVDGKAGYPLIVRAKASGSGSVTSTRERDTVLTSNMEAFEATFTDAYHSSFSNNDSDYVTGAPEVTAAFDRTALTRTTGAQSVYPIVSTLEPIYTVAIYGDSTFDCMQNSVTPDRNGWIERACTALRDDGYPVYPQNFGIGGSMSDTFNQRLVETIPHLKPSIAILQIGSSNDTYYGGTHWIKYAAQQISEAVTACKQYGVYLMLSMPIVRDGDSQLTADRKLAIKQLIIGSGLPYFDFDEIFSNGQNPPGFIPQMTADGTHQSLDGIVSQAEVVKQRILALLQ